MRIGVIADTHMPRMAKKLPHLLSKGLQGVDLIIHAGDWSTLDLLEELTQIAPVVGVYGNNDNEQVRARFPRVITLEANGYQLGVVHGDGKRKNSLQNAADAFEDTDVDMIIFGHSHIPFCEVKNGVLLFNPGSPTDKRRQPRYSYGIVELGEEIHARHEWYEDKG